MTYPPPQAPAPRKRPWKKILLIVAVVLVLCCGGGGFAIYRVLKSASAPVRDAANTFVEDVAADRVDAAYASLCSATKQKFSSAQFAEYVHGRRKITKHHTIGFSVNKTAGRDTGSVTMRLTYSDGSTEEHMFGLVKEGDDYHVCGDPY
jgi:flagellar basal body-associated protein FliL